MPRSTGFDIRLGVKGAAEVRHALKGMGSSSRKALEQLERGVRRAERLRRLTPIARDAECAMTGLGARLGPLGVALSALGPAGSG